MERGYRGYADSPAFTLKYPPSSDRAKRIRVVVSAKVAKKAVMRNLIKRRLRDIWRLIGSGPLPHIYVKKAALTMSFAQLKAELDRLIKKR
ncbi:ribonuclease P protein component [Patescibacteria group bacterium]|nr:ribonuclease P protein component [Patescibacteria group bacterium]